jgi:hypothetical protein
MSRAWMGPALIAVAALAFAGCSIHISKNGISGNVLGHKFSAEKGVLPAGFPSEVPSPSNSTVVYGADLDNNFNVGFGVTGSLNSGTQEYESKLSSAGFKISNVQTASTVASSGSGSGETGTTQTLNGDAFTATGSTYTVEVLSGTDTTLTKGLLKAGQFGIDITVVPNSEVSTTS